MEGGKFVSVTFKSKKRKLKDVNRCIQTSVFLLQKCEEKTKKREHSRRTHSVDSENGSTKIAHGKHVVLPKVCHNCHVPGASHAHTFALGIVHEAMSTIAMHIF